MREIEQSVTSVNQEYLNCMSKSLHEAMEIRNLNMNSLSVSANVPRSTISDVLNGKIVLQLNTLVKIVNTLDLDLIDFLNGYVISEKKK